MNYSPVIVILLVLVREASVESYHCWAFSKTVPHYSIEYQRNTIIA